MPLANRKISHTSADLTARLNGIETRLLVDVSAGARHRGQPCPALAAFGVEA
jgi:hypothetical protein